MIYLFVQCLFLLSRFIYLTIYDIKLDVKFGSTIFIVNCARSMWINRGTIVFLSFFFFEASNRSIALKRQTREERGGSWVSSRIVSGNNCPVISETASTGGCTIIERRNVNDLHWQGYMKPPLSHAARIVFVLTGNWALLGEIVNQSFLPDTQWTWGSITPARMCREDRDLEN